MGLTTTDLLALLNRTMDPAWIEAIQSTADGAAVINALLAIGARVSQVVDDGGTSANISLASGGLPGTCAVTFTRTVGNLGFTLPKGYPFVTVNGVRLVTPIEVVYIAPTTTFIVPLVTLRNAEAINTGLDAAFTTGLTGDVISGAGAPVVTDGAAIKVLGPPGSGVAGDCAVTSATAITGSISDWLAAIGTERGQQRQAYETTEYYRARVRNLADAVSPKAISAAVNGIVDRRDMGPAYFVETFDSGEDAATRALYNLALWNPYYGESDVALRYFWDTFVSVFAGARVDPVLSVSNREARAYFQIEMPGVYPEGTEYRFYSDDGYFDDPVVGFADVGAEQAFAVYMSAYEEANRKRAGGVQFDILSNPWYPVEGYGVSAGPAPPVIVFTLTAPVGVGWLLVDCSYGNALDPGPPGTSEGGALMFTFTDATTFFSPALLGASTLTLTTGMLAALGFPFGKKIATIEGYAVGSVANSNHFYSVVRVIDYVL